MFSLTMKKWLAFHGTEKQSLSCKGPTIILMSIR